MIHEVIDKDLHFVLQDLVTRELVDMSGESGKQGVIQFDHNSERMTFELPRFIEGHDLTLCDSAQVHYINIDSKTKAQSAGVYEASDLAPLGDDKITLSWLVSANATKYKGRLNFVLKFICRSGSEITFEWNTAVYNKLRVGTGIDNGEAVSEEYADILNAWKRQIEGYVITDIKPVLLSSESGGKNTWEVTYGSGDTQILELYNGDQGAKGDRGERGLQGKTGPAGIYYGEEAPQDPTHPVWINPAGKSSFPKPTTWGGLKYLVDSGVAAEVLSPGDTFDIESVSGDRVYTAVVADFDRYIPQGKKNSVVLGIVCDPMFSMQFDSDNSNRFDTSDLKAWANSSDGFAADLDPEFLAVVSQVTVPTHTPNVDKYTHFNDVIESECRFFPPAASELGVDTGWGLWDSASGRNYPDPEGDTLAFIEEFGLPDFEAWTRTPSPVSDIIVQISKDSRTSWASVSKPVVLLCVV